MEQRDSFVGRAIIALIMMTIAYMWKTGCWKGSRNGRRARTGDGRYMHHELYRCTYPILRVLPNLTAAVYSVFQPEPQGDAARLVGPPELAISYSFTYQRWRAFSLPTYQPDRIYTKRLDGQKMFKCTLYFMARLIQCIWNPPTRNIQPEQAHVSTILYLVYRSPLSTRFLS